MNSAYSHFANILPPAAIWSCQCSKLLCADSQVVMSGEQRNCQQNYQKRCLQVKRYFFKERTGRFHANLLIKIFFQSSWMGFLCHFTPSYAVFLTTLVTLPLIIAAACRVAARLRKWFNRDIMMPALTSEKCTQIFTAGHSDREIGAKSKNNNILVCQNIKVTV